MDDVEVDGLRIAYHRAGHGPPVVFVQGFVADGHSNWAAQLSTLADEFTVVAWDCPGAGTSADPPGTFRLPDFARLLGRFIDAIGLDRPHLVGLSFGGAMAIELFGQRPELPRSLVLAGAYAGWSGSLGTAAAEERLRFCERAAGLPSEEFVAALLPSMFSDSAPVEDVRQFAEKVSIGSRSGFVTMARASADADLRGVLPSIDVPTLLLYGDQDVRAPLPVARKLHDAIAGSRLVILPGAGHVSSVEQPDAFNAELLAFLRTAEAESVQD